MSTENEEQSEERFSRNEAICPHCDYVLKDSWELFPGDLEGYMDAKHCPECGKFFSIQKTVAFFYSTKQVSP